MWIVTGVLVTLVGATSLGFVATQVMRPFKVPTGGMEPTLHGITTDEEGGTIPGDHFFVSPLSYRMREPKRGDVVVFSTSGINDPRIQSDSYYIKRIVGLPGEVVALRPPHLTINGVVVTSPPIFQKLADGTLRTLGYQLPPKVGQWKVWLGTQDDQVALGADEYLVLGDNTMKSLDSRFFGPVKRDALLGPVWYVYFPFSRMGTVE
jgi:signal peptidase I